MKYCKTNQSFEGKWEGVGQWEGVCVRKLGASFLECRGSSVGHRVKGSHALVSWWYSDLALHRIISCMPVPASTPVPLLSTASINDKSPCGL